MMNRLDLLSAFVVVFGVSVVVVTLLFVGRPRTLLFLAYVNNNRIGVKALRFASYCYFSKTAHVNLSFVKGGAVFERKLSFAFPDAKVAKNEGNHESETPEQNRMVDKKYINIYMIISSICHCRRTFGNATFRTSIAIIIVPKNAGIKASEI